MRKRTRAVAPDEVDRLASVDPADWLSESERSALRVLVDLARLPDGNGRRVLDPTLSRLAPGAALCAALTSGHDAAVRGVERAVVAYRRRVAGARHAAATGLPPEQVVARFQLGHLAEVSTAEQWMASGEITALGPEVLT